MYTISSLFASYITQPGREFEAQAVVGSTTYDKSVVVEFEVTDSIIPSEELILGSVISSKITIKLKTTDMIAANVKIQPSIRLNGASGYTEWVPFGSFYADRPKYQNSVWQITGFDKLVFSNKPYVPTVTFPCTMQSVLADVATQLGITLDASAVVRSNYMQSYPPDPTYTCRDLIGFYANTMGACARMTKDEKLAFVPIATPSTRTAIGTSSYSKAIQTNPTKTYTGIIATYTPDGKTITEGTVTNLDTTFNLTNPFMIQSILGDVLSIVNGFTYTPFTMDWKGNPALEVGDSVAITLRDGTVLNSTILTQVSTLKGGLKVTSSAPSYSPQRSESDYTGSVQGVVDRNIKLGVVKTDTDTTFRHDDSNDVNVKPDQTTFNFTSNTAGNEPNVRPDGFYLGDTKFESGGSSPDSFTTLQITFLANDAGFTLTRDGAAETWTWRKDGYGRIYSMTTPSARSVSIYY